MTDLDHRIHRTPLERLGRGLVLVGIAAGMTLVGCTGPTQKGLDARNLANEKFDMVRSRVDYDQADQSFRSGNFVKAKQRELAFNMLSSSAAGVVLANSAALVEIGRAHV